MCSVHQFYVLELRYLDLWNKTISLNRIGESQNVINHFINLVYLNFFFTENLQTLINISIFIVFYSIIGISEVSSIILPPFSNYHCLVFYISDKIMGNTLLSSPPPLIEWLLRVLSHLSRITPIKPLLYDHRILKFILNCTYDSSWK